MIFDICEVLREQIAEMNELILKKLAELEEKGSIENALKSVKISQDGPAGFTPVNSDTFKLWCDNYKEKMRKLKEEMKTEKDAKPTGRQMFEMKKNIIEDIKLEGEEEEGEDDEEFKDEEAGDEEDEEEDEAFYYDKALY